MDSAGAGGSSSSSTSASGGSSSTSLQGDEGIWQLMKGNIYFKAKDYAKAIHFYSKGLASNPNDLLTRCNRCMAYLKLRCFRRAIEDANKVLQIEPTNPKIIYRKIKALFGLEKFDEAIEFIEQQIASQNQAEQPELTAEQPGARASSNNLPFELLNLDSLLIQAQTFLHQQQTGEYDLTFFLKDHKTKYHECADYLGPVEIAFINPSKGRGLRATQEIKKGQLVIVSKAICLFYDKERTEISTKLQETQTRLVFEPELLTDVYNLYAGPEYSEIKPTDKIDPVRLERIFTLNHFTNKSTPGCFYDTGPRPSSKGLWYYPSFLNHNCYDESNCFWNVYGNVMFVRATKDIQAGEELHISYCKSVGISYKDKLQIFQRFGFNCNCSLCKWDQSDVENGIQEKRCELLHLLKSLSSDEEESETESSEAMLPIIQQIEEITLSPNNNQNKMYLVVPYFDLGLTYSDEENYNKAAEYMIKAYELIKGTPVAEDLVLILLWNIIGEFINGQQINKAQEWVQVLKNEALTVFGLNAEFVLRNVATDFMTYLQQYQIQL